MVFVDVDELNSIEPMSGFQGRFVHSENMTAAFWTAAAGSKAPDHSHPHEQITFVLEGRFSLTVGRETKSLEPGITAVIPSNVIHSGEALTDCRLVDVFYPVREEYM